MLEFSSGCPRTRRYGPESFNMAFVLEPGSQQLQGHIDPDDLTVSDGGRAPDGLRALNILVYGLNYGPELVGIGKYTEEMSEWFAARGHAVRVVTSYPHYPAWKVAQPYEPRRYAHEHKRGVKILRCPIYVPSRPNARGRAMSHLSFAATSLMSVAKLARRLRPDIIFCIAPSVVTTPVALMASRVSGAAAWLHVQDFEIEAAFELGLLSGRGFRRCMEWLERSTMSRFERVSSISTAMCAKFTGKGVKGNQIVESRNWVDTRAIVPSDRLTSYRKALGLSPNHTVVLYSGSMAAKQGLETIVDAARSLAADRSDIVFVLCGGGFMRDTLVAQSGSIPTVRFLELQSADRMNDLLATADIHVLPQRAKVADAVLPSKLAAMLASGRPVVAMAEAGTQLAAEVKGAGLAIPAENTDALKEAIVALADDVPRMAQLGAEARRIALERWDKQTILLDLEAKLGALAEQRQQGAAGLSASMPAE